MVQAAAVTTLIPKSRERLISPLDAIVHDAGDKLKALTMTRIAGFEADRSDANSLANDLIAIARIVDPVIKAIGDYAEDYLGKIEREPFTDPLSRALDGHATFVLTQKAEDNAEAKRDDLYRQGGYRQRRFG